jgi:peptide/nickel transport system substrate-binding protein
MQQSQEADEARRKQLVWEIERELAEDVARPIIFYERRDLLATLRQRADDDG